MKSLLLASITLAMMCTASQSETFKTCEQQAKVIAKIAKVKFIRHTSVAGFYKYTEQGELSTLCIKEQNYRTSSVMFFPSSEITIQHINKVALIGEILTDVPATEIAKALVSCVNQSVKLTDPSYRGMEFPMESFPQVTIGCEVTSADFASIAVYRN